MKKFLTILIGSSLLLSVSAIAQQEQEQSPGEKKTEKAHPGKEGKQAGKPETAKAEGAQTKAPARTATDPKNPSQGKGKAETAESNPAKAEARSPGKPATANEKKPTAAQGKAEHAAQTQPANKPAAPAPAAVNPSAPPAAAAAQANKPGAAGAPAGKPNPAKKPDPQVAQTIKAEHVNFHAQPKPEMVPSVTFNQSYRINGAESWQGENYAVYRSYRPEMHDQAFYRSHYSRVELIGGGYYYLNNGYWYPAWGYSPTAQYYAYDAPIYVGHRAEPPAHVIADVQSALQQMGYYRGEVDGLLGPLTREALTAYQSDNGLYTTAVIDQPTLDSLNLG